MNSYEAKQEAKRERLRARAEKVAAEAEKKSTEGWRRLQAIPFGQPILVGHHSERADRSYRGRAVAMIDKSVELTNYANDLSDRADAVGTGGISSDDPNAVLKLEQKLLRLEEAHTAMIEQNRDARTVGQQKPFPAYSLTNSSANIRRIRDRIFALTRIAAAPGRQERHGQGWTMREDKDDNRILFTFSGKPSEEVRALLKSRGFRWSLTRNAWVRQITGNARYAADRIIAALPV